MEDEDDSDEDKDTSAGCTATRECVLAKVSVVIVLDLLGVSTGVSRAAPVGIQIAPST